MERRTVPELWREAVSDAPDQPAYLEETADGWRPVSWDEAAERVEGIAQGLLARGVRHGDPVAILSRTRLEWILLDWAVMSIGAVVLGLYPTSSAKECEYILGHCGAVLAFTEDEEQTRKLVSIRGSLPTLREIIPFDWLEKLESDGRLARHLRPDPIEEDDLATLIYTSGTTGPPKGCMLTHRNLVTAATRVRDAIHHPGDVVLLFLPLAHSYGRLAHQSASHRGATVALVADVPRVPEALAAVRPTVLPAVPRVYEKVHANTLGEIERAGGLRTRIGLWALGVGGRASRARREGGSVNGVLALQQRLAERLVFAKVRERLGGRLRVGVSGAAPLSPEVMEFFHALGVPVIEGYGLTETASSATVNEPDDFRIGTVGRPVDGVEIRLADDGEILIRSDSVFAGYYKEPEATAAALTDDGWLRTGDVGELDDHGFLRITDRKKDLIITAGGKNIAPQNLENALKTSRFVSQALVVGDRRPYVTALVTLDEAEVASSGRDPQQLVQELVDDVNRDRTRVEQIKRFVILPRDFSQDEGEVTPTLKLRRRVIHEHFAAEIEQLYAADPV
ncbi:MAG TPA: long-chain fatty acid--CoA ligase [Gaiellaceae bacterium]|jgi:long-chain acyl-CoA synthetase|nr:long-chain fatty acid--CoA ligase [Gaiellaceae bacterium]